MSGNVHKIERMSVPDYLQRVMNEHGMAARDEAWGQVIEAINLLIDEQPRDWAIAKITEVYVEGRPANRIQVRADARSVCGPSKYRPGRGSLRSLLRRFL